MPVFIPPTADTTPPIQVEHRGVALALFRHYKNRACGHTVLKIGGTYGTYDNPDANLVASATEVYLGGHRYEIDADTATALTTAGYGAQIS